MSGTNKKLMSAKLNIIKDPVMNQSLPLLTPLRGTSLP